VYGGILALVTASVAILVTERFLLFQHLRLLLPHEKYE
jgi:hypothetical protein